MKEKISLQQFKEIREKIIKNFNDINELNEQSYDPNLDRDDEEAVAEHEKRIQEKAIKTFKEYVYNLNELTSYNLSDIPKEEWQGIMLVSIKDLDMPELAEIRIDFTDTFANIDFGIVQAEGDNFNFTSCNISNLEKAERVIGSEYMFDERTIAENPSQFLSDNIPRRGKREIF